MRRINNPIIKAASPKTRSKLDSQQVEDLNLFHEDLVSLDKELAVADDLYNEIHGLYNNLTGGDYVPRNIRDIAELARTVVNARQYYLQVEEKRINLKKTISDINFKQNGGDDATVDELANNTARAIVSLVKQDLVEGNSIIKKKQSNKLAPSKDDIDKLEEIVEAKISNGEIPMSRNDMLVGTNDHAVIRYDKKSGQFVAVDNRTGSIIPDFPEDRLPKIENISKITKDRITMNDSSEIKEFNPGEFEYDDEYEDNDP